MARSPGKEREVEANLLNCVADGTVVRRKLRPFPYSKQVAEMEAGHVRTRKDSKADGYESESEGGILSPRLKHHVFGWNVGEFLGLFGSVIGYGRIDRIGAKIRANITISVERPNS